APGEFPLKASHCNQASTHGDSWTREVVPVAMGVGRGYDRLRFESGMCSRDSECGRMAARGVTVTQSPATPSTSAAPLAPWTLGVCSWSLQVKSIAELKALLDQLGINVVQVACGDPHHASWDEGDGMPHAALASGIVMTGAMLGFPGEDYTTPATIKETGGF